MALAFDQDPAVAHEVASNAVENNFLVVAYYGALAALAAYDAYEAYVEAKGAGDSSSVAAAKAFAKVSTHKKMTAIKFLGLMYP